MFGYLDSSETSKVSEHNNLFRVEHEAATISF